MREIFQDPQDILASVSRDRFTILWALLSHETEDIFSAVSRVKELCAKVMGKLNDSAIEIIMGIGYPATNIYELPYAYKNAWEVYSIADRLGKKPGIYCFSDIFFNHLIMSLQPGYLLKYIEKSAKALFNDKNSKELIETFKIYCITFFNKQKTAKYLHIHRNTLEYRLSKIEEYIEIPLNNFENVTALYMFLAMLDLDD